MKDKQLEYFKKELNRILEEQQSKESVLSVKKSAFMINEICKSLFNPAYTSDALEVLKAGRGHLVPKQITTTNKKTGKTYTTTVWVNPNKQNGLKKYTEQDSKGAKIAIGKLIKKIDACNSVEELYSLVLRNKSRFSDNEGKPLPIVEKLHDCVEAKGSRLETQAKKKENAKKLTSSRSARLDGGIDEPESYTGKLRKELKNNLRDSFGLHTNKATGIEANLSGKSVDKMSSDKAIEKSKANGFTVDEHFEVANKIVSLFENAELTETSADKKGSPDLKSIKRFDCDVTLSDGKKANAHITVKESVLNGHKIYSVEVMTLRQKKSRSENNSRAGEGLSILPQSDSSITRQGDSVNDYIPARPPYLETKAEFMKKYEQEQKERGLAIDKTAYLEMIDSSLTGSLSALAFYDKGSSAYERAVRDIPYEVYALNKEHRDLYGNDISDFHKGTIYHDLKKHGVFNEISKDDKAFLEKLLTGEAEAHQNRSDAMKGNQNAKKDFSDLTEALKNGKNITLENAELGAVLLEAGETGKHGYGLKHIIEQRYAKDGKNVDEISALCQLLMDTVRSGDVTRDNARTAEISKNGIVAIVRKEPNDKGFNWVLTGFDNTDTAEEQKKATDAIKTVIANNSYAQERSSFREQVGAVIDSITPQKTAVNTQNNNEDLPENASSRLDKGVAEIRKHYEATKSVLGGKKSVILPNGNKIKCRYKIVEADAPTASHNEVTFASSDNFPTNANGQNINDRDYQHDEDAKMSVISIGNNYNALALQDLPIVTKDGVVVSGNNRTMSSKLAAKNGRDKAYLSELKEQLADGEFSGLDENDLDGFEHPRLILEIVDEHEGKYTTEEFAQYNKDTKKTMNNVEKAVKLTKTLNAEKIQSIADSINGYETMGELYQDKVGGQEFVQKLIKAGIIGENEKAQFLQSDGLLNDTGKDFVETVLVGTILDENNIRGCDSEGGKSIRKKLLRAILPLVENKGNGKEYSFNKELNEAVSLILEVNRNKEFNNIDSYVKQQDMFGGGDFDPFAVQFAKILQSEGEKKFANRMKELGAGCRESASGAMDIFLGEVESKESLLKKFLDIKDTVKKAFDRFFAQWTA